MLSRNLRCYGAPSYNLEPPLGSACNICAQADDDSSQSTCLVLAMVTLPAFSIPPCSWKLVPVYTSTTGWSAQSSWRSATSLTSATGICCASWHPTPLMSAGSRLMCWFRPGSTSCCISTPCFSRCEERCRWLLLTRSSCWTRTVLASNLEASRRRSLTQMSLMYVLWHECCCSSIFWLSRNHSSLGCSEGTSL